MASAVSGEITHHVQVVHFFDRIEKMKDLSPNLIFVSTKTYHLPQVLAGLKEVFRTGTKIVSTHNGLGTEDLIAEAFGVDSAYRMSLNLGASLKGPGEAEVAFFNRPNHLGSLTQENRELGISMAGLLTESGLDTEFVDDIKHYVWKKMVIKCTMASLCAVTDRTLKGVIDFSPTREIAEACFREALAVAKAQGYDLGEDYVKEVLSYLAKVGTHKDSMCYDLANKPPQKSIFWVGKSLNMRSSRGYPFPSIQQ